jgi:primosomal protein N' (replication factor Y) (superfamily II helicase)
VSDDRVVRVIPDLAAVPRAFDYVVPARWADAVGVGSRVRIPLHGRRVGGWVSELDVVPQTDGVIKAISKVSGLGPPPAVLELARWAAWRWSGPLSAVLTVASPPQVVLALPWAPHPARLVPADEAGATAGLAAEVVDSIGKPGAPSLLRIPPATDLIVVVETLLAHAPPPVLVLVPNLGWAERLRIRLERRGAAVARNWAQARAGWPVVVGARGAAFAPMGPLGAALVLDAHDEAYREERAPQFDAAQVVVERASRDGAPCLLTSATPSVVQSARWRVVTPGRAFERAGWPVLEVVDRRAADPRSGLFSEEMVRLAKEAIPGRVIAVLNRRGRVHVAACAACGELACCEHCGRAVRETDQVFACAACGERRPVVCGACGATRFKVLRPGVARVRDELEALLGTPVAEVSGPEREEIPDTPVVVGTEAVLHRIRSAAAVVFLDFDMHVLAPRMSAGESALALLSRAGRLVGGRGSPGAGVVMVQTRMPRHPVLVAATTGNPSPFLAGELAVRIELDLPPASAVAVLSGDDAPASVAELGLDSSELGDGRWMVRGPDHQTLCNRIASVRAEHPALRAVIDPLDV